MGVPSATISAQASLRFVLCVVVVLVFNPLVQYAGNLAQIRVCSRADACFYTLQELELNRVSFPLA